MGFRHLKESYHRTTPLTPEQLAEYSQRAETQTETVLDIYKRHPYNSLSPEDIHFIMGDNILITSVRRAITDLYKAGELIRTGTTQGSHERSIYTYQIAGV